MPVQKTAKIWHNGRFIDWDDARIHVLSHVVNYGTALFEGIRCYDTPHGPAIFRAAEHTARLLNSCKIYRMELEFTETQIIDAMADLVRINHNKACYIRPIVLRGLGDMGVHSGNCPIEAYIATWEWGKYLGKDATDSGVHVCVSSWTRFAPNTLPAMAKSAANYMNSQLIRMEAIVNGYAEGIALDVHGFISEGSGQNIVVVRDEILYTPPIGSSILPGITRDTVIRLAVDLGYQVVEQAIARETLYIADEVFFTGTAAEITPILSVDKIKVGDGRRGPVTAALQDEFFGIIEGRKSDRYGWLTPVSIKQPAAVR